jgi:UDP-N-acetylmuramoyl-tripeptide--D-alanyl-D-alanine ligase
MITYLQAMVRGGKKMGRTLYERRFCKTIYQRNKKGLAILRRPTLRHTTFIGVTGSCGKTTTVNLIRSILYLAGSCQAKSGDNYLYTTVNNVLTLERSTKYCVQEISAHKKGDVAQHVRVLKPRIGVVTVIGTDHYKVHRGAEGAASEKAALIESLPENGVAVLNADDPHVRAMAERTRALVITYGLCTDANVRATDVSSIWPERLTLTVVHDGETARIKTQLVGEHWTPSVLAAIACGIACGVDLHTCAKGVATTEPHFSRCSVHQAQFGVTFILDGYKASYWTIESGLAALKAADAPRKTAVFGTISDYPGAASPRYRRVARQALPLVDRVLFVGPHSGHVSHLCEGDERTRLFSFETAHEAAIFLAKDTLAGELIYIKASGPADHLERIMLAQLDTVVCWRERCGRQTYCHRCKDYGKPSMPKLRDARLDSVS